MLLLNTSIVPGNKALFFIYKLCVFVMCIFVLIFFYKKYKKYCHYFIFAHFVPLFFVTLKGFIIGNLV